MSRRPLSASNNVARPNGPTRRLLVGTGAAAFVCPVLDDDPAVRASETWLAHHAEQGRLGARWQQIETKLFKEHDWSRRTRGERRRFAEQHEMDDLYDQMDALSEQNDALLASMPSIVATTHFGICGKLAVAALAICPEDHPEAHHLITSILRDYRALHGA